MQFSLVLLAAKHSNGDFASAEHEDVDALFGTGGLLVSVHTPSRKRQCTIWAVLY